MSHHVLHVGGSGVDRAPELVVQLEDLLAVRPADGSSGPVAGCVAGAALVRFLLVAAQQLPELLGVGQEERGRVPGAQQQGGEESEPGHGGAGHPDTSAVRVGLSDYSGQPGCVRTSQTHSAGRKYFISLSRLCESTKQGTDYKIWANRLAN